MPNTLHVAFARSDVARGRIVSVDTTTAAAMPGVVAVYVASDLNQLVHNYLLDDELVHEGQAASFRVLADGDVRFVGEPIAMVVADSRYRAEDAVDAIEVDVDALPPVLDYERALDDDAPVVHPEAASNLHGSIPAGETPELDALLASAPVVMTETFRQHRYATVPMEPRGTLASWDPFREELTVWISTQGPHGVRGHFARVLGIDDSQVRVVMPDVGGAFGLKMYPVAGGARRRARDPSPRPPGEVDPGSAREPDVRPARPRRPGDRHLGGRRRRHAPRRKVDFLESAGAFPMAGSSAAVLSADGVPRPLPAPRVRRRPLAPCTRTRRAVVATGVRGCSRPSRASR